MSSVHLPISNYQSSKLEHVLVYFVIIAHAHRVTSNLYLHESYIVYLFTKYTQYSEIKLLLFNFFYTLLYFIN